MFWKDVPEKAANNVLEQTDSLLLHELADHVAQNSANGIETLIGLADVCKANIV
jgi:hypothetical protein